MERLNSSSTRSFAPVPTGMSSDSGFTLVEVTIALMILLVSLLGVAMSFTYAMGYNTGNNARSQALAILQQQVETMRSKKFAPTNTDPELAGGVKAPTVVGPSTGGRFRVSITVDDDVSLPDTQVNPATTFKEITILVTTESPTPGWQFAVPIRAVLRRVRAN